MSIWECLSKICLFIRHFFQKCIVEKVRSPIALSSRGLRALHREPRVNITLLTLGFKPVNYWWHLNCPLCIIGDKARTISHTPLGLVCLAQDTNMCCYLIISGRGKASVDSKPWIPNRKVLCFLYLTAETHSDGIMRLNAGIWGPLRDRHTQAALREAIYGKATEH